MVLTVSQTCRAWLVVAIFLLLQTTLAGLVWSYNTLVLAIGHTFPARNTFLIWLGALPASLPMIAAPVALAVNLRLGTWRTVLGGTVIVTVGVGASAAVPSLVWLYFTYGVVVSTGLAFLLNAPYFFIGELFPYDHPRHVSATSLSVCGFPLATLIFNPVAYAFAHTIGWRYFYVVLASIVLCLGSLLTVIVWCSTPNKEEEDDNLPSKPTSESASIQEGDHGSGSDGLPEKPCEISNTKRTLLGILWLAASLAKCMAYYTPMLTLISQMTAMGIGSEGSLEVMPILGATELVSRLVASYVGDRAKGYTLIVYAVCCVCLAGINLLAFMATNTLHMILYGVALGLFFGPIVAAMYSCGTEVMYGEDVQFLFTVFRTGSGVACLLGPLIAGAIDDRVGDFKPMLGIYAGLYFLSAAIYASIAIITRTKSGMCFEGNCWNRSGLLSLSRQTVSYKSMVNEAEKPELGPLSESRRTIPSETDDS